MDERTIHVKVSVYLIRVAVRSWMCVRVSLLKLKKCILLRQVSSRNALSGSLENNEMCITTEIHS